VTSAVRRGQDFRQRKCQQERVRVGKQGGPERFFRRRSDLRKRSPAQFSRSVPGATLPAPRDVIHPVSAARTGA